LFDNGAISSNERRIEIDNNTEWNWIGIFEDYVLILFIKRGGIGSFIDLVDDIIWIESIESDVVRFVKLNESNETILTFIQGFRAVPFPFSVGVKFVSEDGVVNVNWSVHSGLSIRGNAFELENTHLSAITVITSIPADDSCAEFEGISYGFIVSDCLSGRVGFSGVVGINAEETSSPIVNKNVIRSGT
jgi:hypothetical protein